MAIREYSLKTDGEKFVSMNFRVREFRCKDGSDRILICDALVTLVQSIRDHFGKPVTFNSAYRTPSWNKKQGGAKNSQHLYGKACDVVVAGVKPDEVFKYVRDNFPWAGVGRYDSFTHCDSGPARTFDNRTKKK